GWRAAAYDWIVMADSNVLMPRDYIERLRAAWRADTGVVSSPPAGCRPQGFWAELECAFLNTYQLRWQYAAAAIGLGFAHGKSMLYRRSQIERAGGIRLLAPEPAEDAATTKAVRDLGLRVRLVDAPFEQPLGYRSAREVWARQLRWAQLRQASFRQYYALEILAGSLGPLIAAAYVVAALGLPLGSGLAGAAAWYGAEAALARAAGWHLSLRSLAALSCATSSCLCSGSAAASVAASSGAETKCGRSSRAEPSDPRLRRPCISRISIRSSRESRDPAL